MLLAIDTSTDEASVALLSGDEIRSEWSWVSRSNHSRHLTHAIRQVLSFENATPRDLDAVAVAIGPGSFNGLRVGIAEAKGLTMALQIPLAGIPTLDVIAYQILPFGHDVWAALRSGRDRVTMARYGGTVEHMERQTEYLVLSNEDAVHELSPHALVAGNAAALLAEIRAAQGQTVLRPPLAWRVRRAGYLAELGRRYLQAGGADQTTTLEPLYVRRSAAEEKRAAGGRE